MGGPFSRLRLRRTLASVNTLPQLARDAGRVPRIRTPGKSRLSSPTHQNAGKARCAGCKQDAAKSEESATRCDRMSSKEKTRTNKSRGSGQGEGKKGTCTRGQARWSNTPRPPPRKRSLMLKSTLSMPTQRKARATRRRNTFDENGATALICRQVAITAGRSHTHAGTWSERGRGGNEFSET